MSEPRVSDAQAHRWAREDHNDVRSFGAALADCAADLADCRAALAAAENNVGRAHELATRALARAERAEAALIHFHGAERIYPNECPACRDIRDLLAEIRARQEAK